MRRRWGSSASIATGRSSRSRRSRTPERLGEIGQSIPPAPPSRRTRRQAVHRLDGHLRVLARRAARGARSRTRADFGREIIPSALGRYRVNAYLFRGYWADVGTVESFYDANIMLTQPRRAVQVLRSAPADLHARRGSCPARGSATARCATRSSPKAATSTGARSSSRSSASAPTSSAAPTIRRSVLLGADYYEADDAAPARGDAPRLGIGRDVVLDRVIVDKNARIGDGARLVNEPGVEHADGDGYYIRNGMIIVPKDGVIQTRNQDLRIPVFTVSVAPTAI